ncbi:hypothetical protein ACFE04_005251 [Oxalis oulophora]
MAFSSSFCHPQLLLKVHNGLTERPRHIVGTGRRSDFATKSKSSDILGNQVSRVGTDTQKAWSFVGGRKLTVRPNTATTSGYSYRKSSAIYASWMPSTQISSQVFTLATAAVLPFYSAMVFAPKAGLTKKFIESGIPYVILGLLYASMLYFSWTPDTLRIMFESKYWLPELAGIMKMFSRESTLISVWIHLLTIDLFAARQVFFDGLKHEVPTRHSISLCLLFCPIGVIVHVITKALTKIIRKTKSVEH